MAALYTIFTLPLIYTVFSKHICKLFHFSSIISNGQCNSYNILMILGKIIPIILQILVWMVISLKTKLIWLRYHTIYMYIMSCITYVILIENVVEVHQTLTPTGPSPLQNSAICSICKDISLATWTIGLFSSSHLSASFWRNLAAS